MPGAELVLTHTQVMTEMVAPVPDLFSHPLFYDAGMMISENIIFKQLGQSLYFLYYWLFVFPFSRLYFQGPNWGLGFWNGKAMIDICAELAGAVGPSVHELLQNPDVCSRMILQDFSSKLIFVETFILYPLALYLAWKIAKWVIGKCRNRQPKEK